ncbi:MAG: DTW domain-containing protein [Fibrobacterales bacterium]
MQDASNYIKGKYKSDANPRPFCYRCWKVEELCLCATIPELTSRVRIGILQHPNERYMPINTARFTHLALTNSVMFHGVCFNEHESFLSDFKKIPIEKNGLLFPSPHAVDLSEAPEDLQNLYVVDGTWREAKKMIYNSSVLNDIPHYSINPKSESNYRIRKEPKKNFISTVEAVVMSLRTLEKSSEAYEELLVVFDRMVENQLNFINSKPQSRHRDFSRRKEARKKQAKENLKKYSGYSDDQSEGLPD